MKLICLWNERTIARLAVEGRTPPTGSSLASHIAQCADCRRAWEEFTLLNAELSDTLPDSQMPPALAMPMLPLRRTQSGALRISLATLALSGLLLTAYVGGYSALRPAVPVAPTTATNSLASHVGSRQVTPPKGAPAGEKQSHVKLVKSVIPAPRPVAAPETALPAQASFEYAAVTQANPSITVPAAMSPEAWGDLGAWYAANGEYACAADAYARAYDAQPNPDFAIEAGQSAECAGDMNEAVLYYMHALETSPEPQPHLEEDEPWNETLVTICLEQCSY